MLGTSAVRSGAFSGLRLAGFLPLAASTLLLAACAGTTPTVGGKASTITATATATAIATATTQPAAIDPATGQPRAASSKPEHRRQSGVLARAMSIRGVALLLPQNLAQSQGQSQAQSPGQSQQPRAAQAQGALPESLRAALEQAGLLALVIDEADADALASGVAAQAISARGLGSELLAPQERVLEDRDQDQRGSNQPAGVTALVATVLAAGQSWSMLHAGARSAGPWTLVMEGGTPVTHPAGQLRLLARCWLVPGPPEQTGALSAHITLELVPYLASGFGSSGGGALLREPTSISTLADRGAALMAQRLTITLPPGQALILAPIAVARDAPVGQDPVPSAGQVVRRDQPAAGDDAPPLITPRAQRQIGPAAQRPLSLGEALLTDATPTRTARSATLIVLTAQAPPRFELLASPRGQ